MYFLDTNALYWYVGRDKLGIPSKANVDRNLLVSFLDSREDKVLSASAYVEALVKLRNNTNAIVAIHEWMDKRQLRIINNIQYQTISTNQLVVNMSLSEEMLSNYVMNKVLPIKINLETMFSTAFLDVIIFLYMKYQIDNSGKICPGHEYEIGSFILDNKLCTIKDELNKTLVDAYINHEKQEEKIFKDKFVELLEKCCQYVDFVIDVIASYGNSFSEIDINIVRNNIVNNYLKMHASSSDNVVMNHLSEVVTKNKSLLAFFMNHVADMFSKDGILFQGKEKYAFNDYQVSYIKEEMLVSWLENKQKFRKNDIYDLFFLGCGSYRDDTESENILVDKSTYLITFDKKLARYIDRKNPANGIVIRRFYDF